LVRFPSFEFTIGTIDESLLAWLEKYRKTEYIHLLNEDVGFAHVRPRLVLWMVDIAAVVCLKFRHLLSKKALSNINEENRIQIFRLVIDSVVLHEIIHTCGVAHNNYSLEVKMSKDLT
jgi:hypothetical protein